MALAPMIGHHRLRHLWLASAVLLSAKAFATQVNGRLTAGGFYASETISQPQTLAGGNDAETFSARAYLRVSDWGDTKKEFVADLRDKNDFFGAVNAQSLQLTPENDFQVRQLSVLVPEGSLFTRVGRFPVNEAGAVADGGELGLKLGSNWETAAFGGLNPRVYGQRFYVFNSNASVYGGYLTYQPEQQPWDNSIYFSNAFVTETVGSDTDREYWFETLTYQWSPRSRALLLAYVDFVPNTYIQNGSFMLQQALSERWSSTTNLLTVDVIEYTRLQGLRELLPSSPYHEESEYLRCNFSDRLWSELRFTSGQRLIDGLNKTEFALANDYSHFWGRHVDGTLIGGYTVNFQSNDIFVKGGLAYFSNTWEFTLDEEVRNEQYDDTNTTYHTLTTEVSIARAFRNDFFMTLSAQDIKDERVSIIAGYFKLSYRFGNSSLAPIRDGAPPRGHL